MKNYLISNCCRTTAGVETFNDSMNPDPVVFVGETNFDYYQQMQQISTASFKQNLQGEWSLVCLNETVPSLQDSFLLSFHTTYQLWKSQPCNILYADIDTVCHQSIDIFGQAFSPGCRRNAGLRYFPHNMPQDMWDRAVDFVATWDRNLYDAEQIMYTNMLVDGTLPYVDDLVQQAPIAGLPGKDNSNVFSGVDKSKSIIHLHSSRSVLKALMTMRRIGYGA